MSHIYVTGHKNPDTDTISSAIGYAELKNILDPENMYAPARLGRSTPRRLGRWRRAGRSLRSGSLT